ncbi:MAG: DUF1080 domain-containing protein, partial [Planctomycetales bacterium]|nr:DUF1080 domain-containing protein [Planctomycetales bacterium]
FNGSTLENWEGEPGFWRVEDGAIVGETSAEHKLSTNTFLVWRGGEPADFELKLEFKLGETGNSGVQYRSSQVPDVSPWALRGYQADIDAANNYTGMIYEERGRGFLAPRGQFSRIALDGQVKQIGSFGEGAALAEFVKAGEWNQLHVIAIGNRLTQVVNGHVMSGVIDEDAKGRAARGLIGLQLHVGPPMKIMFRSLQLKSIFGPPTASLSSAETAHGLLSALERLEQSGFRWNTTETGGRGDARRSKGELDSAGWLHAEVANLEFVRKNRDTAVLVDKMWMTPEQAAPRLGGTRGSRNRNNPLAATGSQLPLDVIRSLLKTPGLQLQQNGAGYKLTLLPPIVDVLLNLANRGAGRGLPPGAAFLNPAGELTIDLKDDMPVRSVLKLTGTMRIRDEERPVERTTTTEFEPLLGKPADIPSDAREIVTARSEGREPNVFVPAPGFTSLFNGRDLAGWSGRPEFWSVADGAIVGKTTAEHPTPGNTFLIARDGDKDLLVDDFELRLSYRITANNDSGFGNSGIQYRSINKGDFVAGGYQGDFEAGTRYSGILYDEAGGAGGRGIMAERGERVRWKPDGTKEVTGSVGNSDEIQAAIKPNDWNEYVIIAQGNRLQHFINGKQTIEVVDDTADKRLARGILALQLHAGEPMTVEFKNIQIKSLSAAENAAAGNVTVADGFRLEQLYLVPKDREGSWVATCVDPKGRMIVSDQNGKLYRFPLPAVDSSTQIEPESIDLQIGGAHGLLYAFDSLYVVVNEGGLQHGLYRVLDTDGDDKFDEVKLLKAIDGGGEHGLHAIIPAPDGKSLYLVCGNQTRFFPTETSRVPLHWSEDHLLPRIETGFMAGVLAPGGFITKTDPEGKSFELIANGFRNEFDLAINADGELFTFDADMEWDIGDPWYRPTRVNHVISGAEFGWRNGAGKWPDYYFDSFGAVINIGPGSPTGIGFGYGAKFPARYQNALFIADWSFGKLYAVHLSPEGGSYSGTAEEFVTGQPFPITDVIINPLDGAMYITVGGRQTQSALYRVTYVGDESTDNAVTANAAGTTERELRSKLESFHGHADAAAIDAAWPHLGSSDRAIRHAARIALEWQAPGTWRDRALSETDPAKAITALAALARSTSRDEFHRQASDPAIPDGLQDKILAALNQIDFAALAHGEQINLLRTYSLTFTRLGHPSEANRAALADKFSALFPAGSRELNQMLANFLVYLDAPDAAGQIMSLMAKAPTQEEQIDYAMALRACQTGWTMPLREEYFRWFVEKAANYRGGNTFASSLQTIKQNAVDKLTDQEREALRPILETAPVQQSPLDLLAARKFVKEWTLAELVPLAEQGMASGRDLERGRQVYGAVACASCHRFKQEGGLAGPELTGVAGRFSVKDLLESIVDPSKVISDQYTAVNITTHDGRVITGRVGNLFADNISIVENMLSPGDMT